MRAEYLALPPKLLDALTPPGQGYERNREYFQTRMDVVFDALSAAEAGAAHTAGFLLDPARLNRLSWQHARDSAQPGVAEVLDVLLQRTWKRGGVRQGSEGGVQRGPARRQAPARAGQPDAARGDVPAGDAVPAALAGGEAVQLAANWVLLDGLLGVLDGGKLHPGVQAEVRQRVTDFGAWLGKNPGQGVTAGSRKQAADLVRAYLADPRSVKLRALPAVPPGAPI